MKSALIRIMLIIALVMILCVAASADNGATVKDLSVVSEQRTTVVPMKSDGKTSSPLKDGLYSEVSIFQINHTVDGQDGQDGGLYLLMIRSGDTSALPTESNIYYMSALMSADGAVSGNAYPIDLVDGTYHIEMTDYKNDGKLNEIASFHVENPDNPDNNAIIPGDANGDGDVDGMDVAKMIDYFMKGIPLTEDQIKASDVNNDGEVDGQDVAKVIDYFMKGIPLA